MYVYISTNIWYLKWENVCSCKVTYILNVIMSDTLLRCMFVWWWCRPLRQSVLVERLPSRSIQPPPQHRRPAGREVRRPTGSSQRDIGVSVVCMCWHVKRWFVLCVCAYYRVEHIGVGCVSGEILWRYSISSGHLFALSCVRVLFVHLGSVCSCALIFGANATACKLWECSVGGRPTVSKSGERGDFLSNNLSPAPRGGLTTVHVQIIRFIDLSIDNYWLSLPLNEIFILSIIVIANCDFLYRSSTLYIWDVDPSWDYPITCIGLVFLYQWPENRWVLALLI